MAKLTIQNQDCYLCKKKRVYTNTTRHCVKHMISVAGEVCHVPCDFFDTNEGHFVHSRHSSNHFICHSCKGTYEEIRELEKQHQKYLQMITSIKPAVPQRRQVETSVPDHKIKRSIDSSLQKVETSVPDPKNKRSIDSGLQKLKQYSAYNLQNPYQQWEFHVHSENEVSLLRWNTSTCSAAKRLTIRGHDEEYLLKFKLWGKNIDSIPSIPLKPDDLHSMTDKFHKDVINYLDELDQAQFCEGCYDPNVIKSLEGIPHPNGFINKHQFVAEYGTIESTVRSTSCTFHVQPKTKRCVHCSTLYRSTLWKWFDRRKQYKDSRKDVNSKCPLASLKPDDLLSRSRALSASLSLEKKKKTYWYNRYVRVKEAKVQMPKKFTSSFTSSHFEMLITEAIKVGELTEKSILYYILFDTLSMLRNKPTATQYSQAVIKWCMSLSNKIHRCGYEALREAIPLPCWTTFNSYRFNVRTSDPISEENIMK